MSTRRPTGNRTQALAAAAQAATQKAAELAALDEATVAHESADENTQTADVTGAADTAPAAPADDPATKGEGSGDADHVAAAPTGDGSDDQHDQQAGDTVADRAAALANLAAGLGAGDEVTSGGEVAKDATPLPGTNGVVREWGGSGRYVVLIDAYSAIAHGMHVTAGKGDEVRIDEATAERGLSLHAIAPLDN